jgi:4-hydroxythreonine-4-phosphate dehydrogenase
MSDGYKPLHAMTMGDPAGSGPEIIVKTIADPEATAGCRYFTIGDAGVMREAARIVANYEKKQPWPVRAVTELSQLTFEPGVIEVYDMKNVDLAKLERGKVLPMCGKASYEYIVTGAKMALDKKVDSIVTSAINKDSLNKAGYHYDGHTGLLAELCGTKDVAMMLTTEHLRVIHVTTHVSLREAIERCKTPRILRTIQLADEGMKELGIMKGKIAVAGLNPHAGEDGLFGDEEPKYIVPAIEAARRQGIEVTGPYPPDSIFYRANEGQFDAVIAMYHDQGHCSLKMLGIWLGVNVTLGLPIIRTSVDHGTNFGKAGKGTADPRSMIIAMQTATKMAHGRRAKAQQPKAA